METYYKPTSLESWISLRYRQKNIVTPDDLVEDKICFAYNIFLKRWAKPSHSIETGNFKMISIDTSIDYYKQREEFYHELCHILRHAGRQIMMPKAFRELQEWDANNFVKYAAIPLHMLRGFDFTDSNIISIMSDSFKVTPQLCEERLLKIKNNLYYKEAFNGKNSNVFT
ncbi:phage-like element PBSX protein XkdA [Halalkalibacter wakoensis JCM 9140]|uniref:Phage-like element PBSX protein XkdA n=1 Tax=Halalkalibacter wakoensis JCM 9140 TaxID=1236970 RepID=W4Q4X5_9BACI|nr:ImmA/IrrE family metallo-endopeptidase [Halalkalibacter wakoensis]GAE26990.1 phage-like element PBSX protein XkdA [Halalkalibacter wakoensis JCM 9140]